MPSNKKWTHQNIVKIKYTQKHMIEPSPKSPHCVLFSAVIHSPVHR
jgi:hypothetical protein